MQRDKQMRGAQTVLWIMTFIVAVMIFFGQPMKAQAQWSLPDTNGNIYNTNTGNVGIGTSSPGAKVDVVPITDSFTDGVKVQRPATPSQYGIFSYGYGALGLTSVSTATALANNYGRQFYFNQSDGSTLRTVMVIDGSGNVGIGTTSPDLIGIGRKTLTIQGTSSTVDLELSNSSTGTTGQAGSLIFENGSTQLAQVTGWADGATNSGRISLYTSNAGSAAEVMRIDHLGNVGIGTSSLNAWDPSERAIQIGAYNALMGSAASSDMEMMSNAYWNGTNFKYIGAAPATQYYQSLGVHDFRVAPSGTAGNNITWTDALYINSSGNVGIGTTSPGAKLDVSAGYFRVLGDGTATTAPASGAGLEAVWDNTNSIAYLQSYDRSASAYRKITIDASTLSLNPNSSGKVGIGTTTPGAKLDVYGDINVGGTGNITLTGNINAKYQDVAEWVPATHTLPAGTVVVLNPNQSNQVMASASAYDTRVAGVVSAKPALALGEGGKDKVLVATTGRVKVKVDATRSPIHVGDLLVTSDQEGVAMKSVPVNLGGVELHRPGTLIGKALEPLEKGTGEILVLLSLQ